jgi:class 3 adenylate cyclase
MENHSTLRLISRYGRAVFGGSVPTRTLTVVFTDLANYTASVGRSDREGVRNLIALHEQKVAPVVERCGGRIVKNLGDSYMVLFEAATDAAQACLELITGIAGQDGFTIRAAMATGDVESIDGDAFGEATNLAARVLAKTPAGEVWMSSTSRMCMNQTEVAWEAVGRFALKGIAGDVPVYRLVPRGRAWLPQGIVQAVRLRTLVRIRPDGIRPSMPPDPVILLEDFDPSSEEIRTVVDSLPVVDPANLWLQAYSIAPSDRYSWTDLGRGLLIGTSEAVGRCISAVQNPVNISSGTDTIILDLNSTAHLDLVMSGLALPAVPMSDVVAGYTYDLLADGRWANHADTSVLRLEVLPSGVQLEAKVGGVIVAGQRLDVGQKSQLKEGDRIQTPTGAHRFHVLGTGGYVGVLVSDTQARLGVADGQMVEIGREPAHPGFALPDRRGQENIRWCVGTRAARAREGGFTMDRALAGRRQAAVQIDSFTAKVIGLHKTCATHVFRSGSLNRIDSAAPLEFDDMIVVGTSVISVRAPQV